MNAVALTDLLTFSGNLAGRSLVLAPKGKKKRERPVCPHISPTEDLDFGRVSEYRLAVLEDDRAARGRPGLHRECRARMAENRHQPNGLS